MIERKNLKKEKYKRQKFFKNINLKYRRIPQIKLRATG